MHSSPLVFLDLRRGLSYGVLPPSLLSDMFRTLSGTADPVDCSDPVDEKPKRGDCNNSLSGASTQSDVDIIETTSDQPHNEEYEDHVQEEKPTQRPSRRSSKDLTRTTSNALSRVSSRLTTRSLPDPGPPPDGGLKAWTQIACGWVAIATCWGWINCFGNEQRIRFIQSTLC